MTNEHGRRPSTGSERDGAIVVELAVVVPVTTGELFRYLADPGNNPEWNWAVKSVNTGASDGPGEGIRFSQERVTAGGDAAVLEITRYEPDSLLEVSGTIEEGRVTYRHHLTAIGANSTRLSTRVMLAPPQPVMRPDLVSARLGAAVSTNLESLRGHFHGTSSFQPLREPSR